MTSEEIPEHRVGGFLITDTEYSQMLGWFGFNAGSASVPMYTVKEDFHTNQVSRLRKAWAEWGIPIEQRIEWSKQLGMGG